MVECEGVEAALGASCLSSLVVLCPELEYSGTGGFRQGRTHRCRVGGGGPEGPRTSVWGGVQTPSSPGTTTAFPARSQAWGWRG